MTPPRAPRPASRVDPSRSAFGHRHWRWPLAVLLLCLAAVRPWFRLELVCSDDISLHLLRAAQLESLLRQGVLYSRWAPDMALGYGYPFFNFYAPLSTYFVAALSLVGLANQVALMATFALATVAAGMAVFLLVRDTFSARSALVAAVAYAYAPYLGYDVFFRGNLAETVGWVFPPLALWAMGRLARRGNRSYLAITALAYAAVLLTHNVFALIFSPLLAAYGLVSVLSLPPAISRPRRLAAATAAVLLGIGSAAFFWLPALAERAYIHSDRLLVPPVFVYWSNFIDLRELLALPRPVHPDLINPSPPRALGLIPVLLGLPALLGLGRFRRPPRRAQVAFFAAALAAYAWMTTAGSEFVWDTLPLLEYVQFPWRLLGPAALCLAVLVGAAAELLPRDWRGALAIAAALVLLVLGDLFWITPRYCPWTGEFHTAEEIPQFERQTNVIGTTAKGEYLPRTVDALPEEIATTPLDPAHLPPGTRVVEPAGELPIGARLVITATRPFTAVYNGLHYPGWRVRVDGAAVPITPEEIYGRITFPVPQGRHRVSIRFGETPLRRAADLFSLACLGFTLGLLLSPLLKRRFRRPAGEGAPEPRPAGSGPPPARAWGAWGLVLLAAVVLIQHVDNPLHRPGLRDGSLPGLDVQTRVSFEGGLSLLGYNRRQGSIRSGDRARFDLFWTVGEKPTQRYQRTIALTGPNGLRWDRLDTIPPRNFREPPPTWMWYPGRYAQDSHYVETPVGTPPGSYDLSLIVFERETLAPMRVLEPDGQPGPPALPLGQITVTPPRHSPDPDGIETEIGMDLRLEADLGPLTLLGATIDRAEAAPGDPFLASFFWRAEEKPTQDLTARLALLGADGMEVAAFDLPPTLASHPTSAWQAGDLWLGRHPLHLPVALVDGAYTWRVTLLPLGQAADLPTGLRVIAPSRTFTPPPVDQELETRLGDFATLVGANVEPVDPSGHLTVTLVWRAEAETHTSYRVFVHLLGPGGALLAQSDGVPAGWSRPTTGWLPGEYVTDTHALALPPDAPPGPYTLVAGLYEPGGARLTAPDGRDTVTLTRMPMENP